MSGLGLYLSMLNTPIDLFIFTLTWDNFLPHCKCSSKSIPRYLTDWVGISIFPSSLNLTRSLVLGYFGKNIISSLCCTFRHNLFALSQYERFERMLFNCLAKTCKDFFNWIMLLSSAKWYFLKIVLKKYIDHWFRWVKVMGVKRSLMVLQLRFL